ncbi:hypothetical protein MJO29_015887 [Puccinia striiformis f. sp. tritici]|nr:hypothetical protein MJO29_015887 [Puccinia striiformis f. sp. tritici]
MSEESDFSDSHPSDKLVRPVNPSDRSVRLANWSDLQVHPVGTCRTFLSDLPSDNVVRAPSPRKARSAMSDGSSVKQVRWVVERACSRTRRTGKSDFCSNRKVRRMGSITRRTAIYDKSSDRAVRALVGRDIPRMNVALTQAKSSMFIMGNQLILSQDPTWKALVEDAAGRSATSESNVLLHVLNPHRFQTSTIYPIDVFQQSINSKPPVGLLMTPKQASEQSQARGTVTRANQALKRKISIDASDGVQDRRDKAAGPSTIRGSHPVNPQQILGITPAVIPLPKEAAGQSCPGPSAPENFWYVLSAR